MEVTLQLYYNNNKAMSKSTKVVKNKIENKPENKVKDENREVKDNNIINNDQNLHKIKE